MAKRKKEVSLDDLLEEQREVAIQNIKQKEEVDWAGESDDEDKWNY